jgi:hypothetical protein
VTHITSLFVVVQGQAGRPPLSDVLSVDHVVSFRRRCMRIKCFLLILQQFTKRSNSSSNLSTPVLSSHMSVQLFIVNCFCLQNFNISLYFINCVVILVILM